jgi:Na+-driven multidrug efflux pump
VVFGCASLIGGVMRASGTVLVPMLISVLCIALIEVPSAYVLSLQHGLEGVWMAHPITFVAMLVLQSAFYRLVWRHKKIERLV